MFTADQLADMERAIEEEYRKDREAIERLKRYLQPRANGTPQRVPLNSFARDDDDDNEVINAKTIIGRMSEIIAENLDQKWTVPIMVGRLRKENFPLHAKKPDATIALAFKKLRKRGKVKLIRQGMGRTPSVYKGISQTQQDVLRELDSIESERAAS